MTKVYFSEMYGTSENNNMPSKVRKLYDALKFDEKIEKGNQVAIKLHFGEKGNTTYMHPVAVRQVVDKIKEKGGKPFLTDTNTLYSGSRTNSVDHLMTAIENGFAYAVTNAPIIIADGLYSQNSVDVDIGKKHFSSVKIGGEIFHSDAMFVLSHFKGHSLSGFGGAIKNMAMGCAAASGKQQQHSDVKPTIDKELCIGCGRCKVNCPVEAIDLVERKAEIDDEICYGCGECVTVCPVKPVRAVSIEWDSASDIFLEKMAEYAYGSIKNKMEKVGFITFVRDITPLCDCCGWSGKPLAPDVGILASTDPVALDRACYDLVCEKVGYDPFAREHKNVDGKILMEYGEKIGLGKQDYILKQI
ncbi:MAG: DUF362 domain-containing protein [Tissierellia bacterium]|nr:DUF362 domain-containing protein [Tissierellia bacterium]